MEVLLTYESMFYTYLLRADTPLSFGAHILQPDLVWCREPRHHFQP